MGTCCGGKVNIVNQATAALDDMLGMMGFEEPVPIDPNAPARLEFIGDEWGEQVWFSLDRQRQYKAGRDPSWRYVDADPKDVPHLLSFGKFARVALPTTQEPDEPDLIASVETRTAPRGRGRRA